MWFVSGSRAEESNYSKGTLINTPSDLVVPFHTLQIPQTNLNEKEINRKHFSRIIITTTNLKILKNLTRNTDQILMYPWSQNCLFFIDFTYLFGPRALHQFRIHDFSPPLLTLDVRPVRKMLGNDVPSFLILFHQMLQPRILNAKQNMTSSRC